MGREVKVTAEFFERLKEQGSAWLVMEGEPSPECAKNWPDAVSGDYNPACCRFPKSCSADVLFAPAELVAAAAPCKRCDGARNLWWPGSDRSAPCPACCITLVGPCPNDTDGDGDCAWCSRPGWSHVLGHAYADSEVLHVTEAVVHPDGGCWIHVPPHGRRHLPTHGDPASLVGKFALKVRLA